MTSEKDVSDTQSLDFLKEIVTKGLYDDALEIIEETEKSNELSEEEFYSYLNWKCQIYNKRGPIEESLKLIEDFEEKVKNLKNSKLLVDLSLNKIEALWRLGFYDESRIEQNLLEEFLSKLPKELKKEFEEKKAILLVWNGLDFFLAKYEFEESLKYINKGLALFTKLKISHKIGWCKEILGWIHTYKKELDIAEVYTYEGLELYEKIGNKRDLAWTNFLLGWLYFFKNEHDKAIKFVEKSSELFETIGNKQWIAHTHNFLALIHLNKGDFDLSLKHTEIGLKILESTEYQKDVAFSLAYRSMVYLTNLDYDSALENMQKTIPILRKFGNKFENALVFSDIGRIYHYKGEFENARNQFEESLRLAQEVDDAELTANTLFSLVLITYDQTDIEKANQYLLNLRDLNKTSDIPLVRQFTNVAESLLLKSSSRALNRGKAEELLKDVLKEKIQDKNLIVTALVTLCEILLADFKISKDNEILAEIHNYIDELTTLAKDQNMFSIMGETYRLRAQLSLAELNLKDAQILLDQARVFAEGKDLKKLEQDIISDQEKLEKQLEMWRGMMQRKVPVHEALDYVSIDEILQKIGKEKTISSIEGEKDETMMFKKLFALKL
jgi:tetratricopeptide (TPR) repeat protein